MSIILHFALLLLLFSFPTSADPHGNFINHVCVCLSYVVLHSAVLHGWVKTERQIINTDEERRERE